MQSLFIGLGAVIASALPWLLTNCFGVARAARAGAIPLNVKLSFYVGAVAFLGAVLWTIVTTKEYPPDDLAAFRAHEGRERPAIGAAARGDPRGRRGDAARRCGSWRWCRSAPGSASSACGSTSRWRWPATSSARPTRPRRCTARASSGAGICFAMYSAVCFAFSFVLPRIAAAARPQARPTPVPAAGAAGLLSVAVIHDKYLLLLSMAGVGIAWASILSMPYAILAGSLPPGKTGVYMGIFNFFIVIPEIVASLGFGWVMQHLLDNNRLAAVVAGGVFMVLAAVLMQLRSRRYDAGGERAVRPPVATAGARRCARAAAFAAAPPRRPRASRRSSRRAGGRDTRSNPVRLLMRGQQPRGRARRVAATASRSARVRVERSGHATCSSTSRSTPRRAPGPRRAHAVDDRGRHRRRPVRGAGAAAARGPLPGLLARRRDLPDHARPLRERRPGERRSRRVARACSTARKAPLLPRRRPAGRHRPAAYLKDLGVTALWLNPWYDNVNHLNEKRDATTARRSPTTTATAPWTSTRVEEHFGDLAKLRELVDDGPRLGHQGHPGPGREPHRPVPPLGRGSADADLVQRHRGRAPRRTPGRPGRSPTRTPRPSMQRDDARRLVHRHPARPQPGRSRGRALPHPEHALVGRRDRASTAIRQDTLALRAAPLLARLDGGDQARVPALTRGGRDVRRRPGAGLVLPGRRRALRRHRHAASTRSSTSRSTTRSAAPSPRASRCASVAQMLARDRLYPRPGVARDVPRACTTCRAS